MHFKHFVFFSVVNFQRIRKLEKNIRKTFRKKKQLLRTYASLAFSFTTLTHEHMRAEAGCVRWHISEKDAHACKYTEVGVFNEINERT